MVSGPYSLYFFDFIYLFIFLSQRSLRKWEHGLSLNLNSKFELEEDAVGISIGLWELQLSTLQASWEFVGCVCTHNVPFCVWVCRLKGLVDWRKLTRRKKEEREQMKDKHRKEERKDFYCLQLPLDSKVCDWIDHVQRTKTSTKCIQNEEVRVNYSGV